jgi:linoleoyl-CoA desaturase
VTSLILLTVFGISYTALAFTIGHDTGHKTVFKNTKIDSVIYWITYNLLGIPPYIWNYSHNIIHHPNVNIETFDMDIDRNPILRLTPMTPLKSVHKYQHIYCFFLYPLFFFNKFFLNDFNYLKKIESRHFINNKKHPLSRKIEHIVMKAAYLFMMVGIPTIYSGHSFLTVLTTYVLFMMVMSVFIGLTLASAHLNIGTLFLEKPENENIHVSFSELQIKTAIDFSPTSKFWGFLCGGINAHVAHHLFPKICSDHYPEITKMIKASCEKYGIEYREMNILQLWKSHLDYLKILGKNASPGTVVLDDKSSNLNPLKNPATSV